MIGGPSKATRALGAALALCGALGCNQIFGVEQPVLRRADAGATQTQVQGQCLLPSDCAPDETCLFERCSAPCAQDRDCPDTAVCLQTARGKAACVRVADNHCAEAAACPDGTRCINSRCSSLCDAAGESACLLGRICEDGVCVLSSERAGTTTAQNVRLPDASVPPVIEPAPLPAAGTAGGSAGASAAGAGVTPAPGECAAGETRCAGNAVETCTQDGHYAGAAACAGQTCIGGRCFGSCAPGEMRCASDAIELCDETGHFAANRSCPGQACLNAVCVGSCAPRQMRCETATSFSVCGDDGSWGQLTSCGAAACSGGQCTGSCTPDSRRCKPGAQLVERCTAEGIWEESAVCENQACVDGACSGECSPGARMCSGGGVRECSDQGSFGALQACTDQACVAGRCTGVCAPRTTRCNSAGQVETCSANGVWGGATGCSGQTCVSGTCSGVCAPSDKRCAGTGNRVESCSATGQWQVFQQCSAPREICRASACASNTPVDIGYADASGWGARSLLDNRMYLVGPFDAGFAAELLAINLIGSAANGASADMFLYQDDAGRPGRFRARASSTLALVNGNASSDLKPAASQIPAGVRVWIGAVFFGGAQLPQPTVTTFPTSAYVLSFSFGGAPPDPFPVSSAMFVPGAALPFFISARELPL